MSILGTVLYLIMLAGVGFLVLLVPLKRVAETMQLDHVQYPQIILGALSAIALFVAAEVLHMRIAYVVAIALMPVMYNVLFSVAPAFGIIFSFVSVIIIVGIKIVLKFVLISILGISIGAGFSDFEPERYGKKQLDLQRLRDLAYQVCSCGNDKSCTQKRFHQFKVTAYEMEISEAFAPKVAQYAWAALACANQDKMDEVLPLIVRSGRGSMQVHEDSQSLKETEEKKQELFRQYKKGELTDAEYRKAKRNLAKDKTVKPADKDKSQQAEQTKKPKPRISFAENINVIQNFIDEAEKYQAEYEGVSEKEPEIDPTIVLTFMEVQPEDLGQYNQRFIRLLTRDGLLRQGILVDVDDDKLVLQLRFNRGRLLIYQLIDEIWRVQVLQNTSQDAMEKAMEEAADGQHRLQQRITIEEFDKGVKTKAPEAPKEELDEEKKPWLRQRHLEM